MWVQVLSEMCKEMRTHLERSKLELCVWSNDASLSYLQAEMHALIGKLECVLPSWWLGCLDLWCHFGKLFLVGHLAGSLIIEIKI